VGVEGGLAMELVRRRRNTDGLTMRRRYRLCAAVLVAFGIYIVAGFASAQAQVPTLSDCDTPNSSDGVGVLNTPQNEQPLATVAGVTAPPVAPAVPYLSHKLGITGRSPDGSTAYTFTVTSARPASSTFTGLLQCAWDRTSGGTSMHADYATTYTNPAFRPGAFTLTVAVKGADAICDKVRLTGVDGTTGQRFTDYSDIVAAPDGTACSPAHLSMSTLAQLQPDASIAAASGCTWTFKGSRSATEPVENGQVEIGDVSWFGCGTTYQYDVTVSTSVTSTELWANARVWVCGSYKETVGSATFNDESSDVWTNAYNYGSCGPQADDYQSWAKPAGIFHWAPYTGF
jgi:hypothetical protein